MPPEPAEALGNGLAEGLVAGVAEGFANGSAKGLATGLAPVIDGAVHTLILGSFPSRASLARGQYYGHPRNHFWPLLQAVLGEPLVALPYERRLETLLARGVGLWDVIGRCERPGSLDSDIRRAERNAFDALLGSLPRLQRVFFNGATAGRAAPAFAARGLAVQVLPSSSPALTIGLPAKLAAWAAIAEPVAAGAGSTGTVGLSSAMAPSIRAVTERASRAVRTTGAADSTAPMRRGGSPRAHRTVGAVGVTDSTDANSTLGSRALNATAEAEGAAGSARRERGRSRSIPREAAQPARVGHGDPAC